MACEISVPRPGIESRPPAWGARSLSHRTTGRVSGSEHAPLVGYNQAGKEFVRPQSIYNSVGWRKGFTEPGEHRGLLTTSGPLRNCPHVPARGVPTNARRQDPVLRPPRTTGRNQAVPSATKTWSLGTLHRF